MYTVYACSKGKQGRTTWLKKGYQFNKNILVKDLLQLQELLNIHSIFIFYLKHCGGRVQNGLCCSAESFTIRKVTVETCI